MPSNIALTDGWSKPLCAACLFHEAEAREAQRMELLAVERGNRFLAALNSVLAVLEGVVSIETQEIIRVLIENPKLPGNARTELRYLLGNLENAAAIVATMKPADEVL